MPFSRGLHKTGEHVAILPWVTWCVLYKMMKGTDIPSPTPFPEVKTKHKREWLKFKKKTKMKSWHPSVPHLKIYVFSDYKNIFSTLPQKQHTYFLHSPFPILSKSTILSNGSKLVFFYENSILLFKNKVNMLIKCITNQLHTKGNILSLAGHHFVYILTFKNAWVKMI